ncbi:hypothetical protein REC12_05985 [Desulfosporosinus sp. PR]|nr:hypothetical protein [Desulfosporosinus sp. PR]
MCDKPQYGVSYHTPILSGYTLELPGTFDELNICSYKEISAEGVARCAGF